MFRKPTQSVAPANSTPKEGARPVRILALMEAASVTGPAKNLIGFAQWLNSESGRKTGLALSIATFDRNSRVDATDGFVSSARRAGVEVAVLHERRRFDMRVMSQIESLVETLQPDIIQTHNNKSHLLVRLSRRARTGRLWFAFQHGDAYTDLKQRLYNQVDRFSLRGADRVVTVCEAFSRRLRSYGILDERLRVLHNSAVQTAPASTGERSSLRAGLQVSDSELLILSVGRLSREKGHADLVRALAALPDAIRPWRAVFVGTGPELEPLKILARKLGIEARVKFAGFRADAGRLYRAADIFVLPSHSEGSSNALLEAMVAQLPIVATAVGGNPEILEAGRTGMLVPCHDPHALARALGQLLSDPTEAAAMGFAAAQQASTAFSVERYRERLCSFYREAGVCP
ncbi:MAG: glycosyltransferase [Proteobacteria bacterium]|nr:glycosyltransferase [Pseudomonadota bacterium]